MKYYDPEGRIMIVREGIRSSRQDYEPKGRVIEKDYDHKKRILIDPTERIMIIRKGL